MCVCVGGGGIGESLRPGRLGVKIAKFSDDFVQVDLINSGMKSPFKHSLLDIGPIQYLKKIQIITFFNRSVHIQMKIVTIFLVHIVQRTTNYCNMSFMYTMSGVYV